MTADILSQLGSMPDDPLSTLGVAFGDATLGATSTAQLPAIDAHQATGQKRKLRIRRPAPKVLTAVEETSASADTAADGANHDNDQTQSRPQRFKANQSAPSYLDVKSCVPARPLNWRSGRPPWAMNWEEYRSSCLHIEVKQLVDAPVRLAPSGPDSEKSLNILIEQLFISSKQRSVIEKQRWSFDVMSKILSVDVGDAWYADIPHVGHLVLINSSSSCGDVSGALRKVHFQILCSAVDAGIEVPVPVLLDYETEFHKVANQHTEAP